MKQPISFKRFLEKPLLEQQELQKTDYSDFVLWENEYLNGTTDCYGNKVTTEKVNRDLSKPEQKIVDGKMRELEKVLKNHDWSWSPDGPSMMKYMKDKDRIKGLSSFIFKYTLSYDDQNDLYDKYYKIWKKRNPMREEMEEKLDKTDQDKVDLNITMSGSSDSLKKFLEDKKDTRLTDYEKFLQKKMKEWKIKSTKDLSGEPLKRFWDECDKEYKCKNKSVEEMVKEIANKPSNTPSRNISLGLGEERRSGEKSITASSFCDAGNLFDNQPTYIPPSQERIKKLK